MVSYQLHRLFASLNAMMDFRRRRSLMDRIRCGKAALFSLAAPLMHRCNHSRRVLASD